MKYKVGDLILVKDIRLHPRPRPELFNSYGIITKAINHSDAWEGETTSDDNGYIWYSQVDGKEYYFCENELTGEVVE
jgi:hypothetical protein